MDMRDEQLAEAKKIELLTRPLDVKMIKSLDKNGDGLTELEFLIGMLVQTCDLDIEKDINPWLMVWVYVCMCLD